MEKSKQKPIIFSGIQPTGNLHLGNYLGAVKNWVDLQNSGEYDCYFCIVDYHSLTGNRTAAERREYITMLAAELIAIGIDPEKSTFFVQSHVPEHTELAWIFNTITPIGELERMTQYKDKARQQDQNINTGLFTYPVLMAADILLYQPDLIPVGEDQVQHVELTRDTARWFNNRYGEFFHEVKVLLTETPRVKSLLEPTKKMSKSLGLGHVIDLADEPEVLMKKIKKAVTATEGGQASPGVENLLLCLKYFGDSATYDRFVDAEVKATIQYGALKEQVGTSLAEYFKDFRTRRTELLEHHEEIAQVLIKGAAKARIVAQKNMEQVRRMIGVR